MSDLTQQHASPAVSSLESQSMPFITTGTLPANTFTIEPLPHPRLLEVAAWAARGLRPMAIKHAIGDAITYQQVRHTLTTRACKEEISRIGRSTADATVGHAIATRAHRVASTSERHSQLMQIIEERSAAANPRLASPDPEFAVHCANVRNEPIEVMLARFPEWGFDYDAEDPLCGMTDPFALGVPGAETGLLVCTIKSIGRGENTQIVREWATDTQLVTALRNEEEAVARHLGEWAPSKITTIMPMKAYFGFDPDEL